MAKIVFAMNMSLDGYVDHDHESFAPDITLFRQFIADAFARNLANVRCQRLDRH